MLLLFPVLCSVMAVPEICRLISKEPETKLLMSFDMIRQLLVSSNTVWHQATILVLSEKLKMVIKA